MTASAARRRKPFLRWVLAGFAVPLIVLIIRSNRPCYAPGPWHTSATQVAEIVKAVREFERVNSRRPLALRELRGDESRSGGEPAQTPATSPSVQSESVFYVGALGEDDRPDLILLWPAFPKQSGGKYACVLNDWRRAELDADELVAGLNRTYAYLARKEREE